MPAGESLCSRSPPLADPPLVATVQPEPSNQLLVRLVALDIAVDGAAGLPAAAARTCEPAAIQVGSIAIGHFFKTRNAIPPISSQGSRLDWPLKAPTVPVRTYTGLVFCGTTGAATRASM